MNPRKLVMIESPYRGEILRNEQYARHCLKDSIDRREAPFASHLLYTQKGVLNDDQRNDRNLGIDLAFSWSHVADLHAFYTDLGWTQGMIEAYEFCKRVHQEYEFRSLIAPSKIRQPDEYYAAISHNLPPPGGRL